MLKENKKGKQENVIGQAEFIMIILLIQSLLPFIKNVSEVSIFQADQLKMNEEQTCEQYFDLGNTLNFQDSEIWSGFSEEKQENINYHTIGMISSQDIHGYESASFYNMENEQVNTPQRLIKSKRVKQSINSNLLNLQYQILESYSIPKTIHFSEDFLIKAGQLYQNKWKSIKCKNTTKKKQNQQSNNSKKHKFLISKTENWDVHLKSLRTHFMQKIFYKIWKVPTQSMLKDYCFNGSDTIQNKIRIKNYLYQELKEISNKYSTFALKLQIYEDIILRIISAIDIAINYNNQIDDLVFEVLFKAQIAELFN